ncbi:DUF4236 domain-containing protein [Hippea jasoniae]|uniref:DUF4236 domain-containing protein n=1 Tax=Hippea jasoniae TaxID=944479 RepID=UPI000557982F|nr:DUF4236 domain-containing protein [Hippea jasoniae]
MSLRFYKRKKILPGVYLNFSKYGMSITFKILFINFTVPLWNKVRKDKKITYSVKLGKGVYFRKSIAKKDKDS